MTAKAAVGGLCSCLCDHRIGLGVIDPGVIDLGDDDIAIAAISVVELTVGALLASGQRRVRRQSYVDDICATIPILTYDRAVALEHADLLVSVRRTGRARRAHDLIIAATAVASRRVVVTADRTAFTDLSRVTSISDIARTSEPHIGTPGAT